MLALELWGNSLDRWIAALAIAAFIILGAWGLKRLTCRLISRQKAGKHRSPAWEASLLELVSNTKLMLVGVLGISIGSRSLEVSKAAASYIGHASFLAILTQIAIWGSVMIAFWINYYANTKSTNNGAHQTTVRAIGFLAKVAFFAVLLLWGLDNFGINITALVAGLGVGGIAVALAVQNILGDLFASLSIVLDKPFVIGDFITVDEYQGTIEHIGMKTTRVKSLSGELIIFPNSNILQSRVRNFQKLRERRVVFSFGLTYDTPKEVLKQIPDLVRKIIEKEEKVRFDRAHFKEFGESDLKFEVVYIVNNPDYNLYMDIQQRINFELFEQIESIGAEFAFPSRTIYLSDSAQGTKPSAGYSKSNGNGSTREQSSFQ